MSAGRVEDWCLKGTMLSASYFSVLAPAKIQFLIAFFLLLNSVCTIFETQKYLKCNLALRFFCNGLLAPLYY